MPIFGAELSEVAPKDPVGLAVVDDQYVEEGVRRRR